jgi:hypothetical protein
MTAPHQAGQFPRAWQAILALLFLIAAALIVVACSNTSTGSSGSTTPTATLATVNVRVSDPATCQSPSGPFSHVYVTITDVRAHVSATAGDSDPGWVDLTPGLSTAPMQVDLLGQANNQCFLATLGDAQQLQAASYQQIRLILAPNGGATMASNPCGGDANCVVLASDSSVHTLELSSEAKTGIKIPSGQIASGKFTIAAGQTEDLDIDFIACQSIVHQGNGKYRLKPVLHAGEVSTTSTSINGKVMDGVTGDPVNGTVLVAVEQRMRAASTGCSEPRWRARTARSSSVHFRLEPTTLSLWGRARTAPSTNLPSLPGFRSGAPPDQSTFMHLHRLL